MFVAIHPKIIRDRFPTHFYYSTSYWNYASAREATLLRDLASHILNVLKLFYRCRIEIANKLSPKDGDVTGYVFQDQKSIHPGSPWTRRVSVSFIRAIMTHDVQGWTTSMCTHSLGTLSHKWNTSRGHQTLQYSHIQALLAQEESHPPRRRRQILG